VNKRYDATSRYVGESKIDTHVPPYCRCYSRTQPKSEFHRGLDFASISDVHLHRPIFDVRPIYRRVRALCRSLLSQFGRPLFCLSFSWALLRANSCARQLRVFCFPGSSLESLVPSQNAAARFGSSSPRFSGAPRKWSRKRIQKCLTYMLSGIACGAVRSPTVPSLEHGLSSLATPGTEACDAVGGAFRPQWRGWPKAQRL
jgi:hypothetical protein